MIFLKPVLFASAAAGSFVIYDPSDVISPAAWQADNALIANYSVAPIFYQYIANVAPTVWSDTTVTSNHKTYSVNENDTSVVVISNHSTVHLSHDTFIKEGYSSNLLQASFFGANAAVWVGNESTAYITDSNVTVHNGAANIYVYGTDSVLYADNLFLYSSGPVSHGLYGAGNGTIHASNIRHYSGGRRSSAFSGDSPAGYVHVSDSVAHTDGIGSAICYALGLCNITNLVGHASHAPVMFMDSVQTGIWTDCDLTAGLLAGMVLFGSADREAGGTVTLNHTKLTTLGSDMASLWFGNTIATANIIASEFNNSASGIFLIANTSQVTQEFDYFAGPEQNSAILPAQVNVTVTESTLSGDLIAYNGSSIAFHLGQYSHWTGAAKWGYGTASIGVYLDGTSQWTLTADSKVQNLTSSHRSLSNIFSNGHTIYYNDSSPANEWLDGKTISLNGGGKATPL